MRDDHRETLTVVSWLSHDETEPPVMLRACLQALDAHVAPRLERRGNGARTLRRHDDTYSARQRQGEGEVTDLS